MKKHKSTKEDKRNSRTSVWVYIFGGFGGLFTVFGIFSPFYIKGKFLNNDEIDTVSSVGDATSNVTTSPYTYLGDLGPIGDWFGGSSTPLFTLASFFILVAALIAQMLELRATRQEFSKQNETFTEQNKLISVQRFESTFFQMVSLYNEIVNSFSGMDNTNKEVSGREQLGVVQKHFEDKFKTKVLNIYGIEKGLYLSQKIREDILTSQMQLEDPFVYSAFSESYDVFYNGEGKDQGKEQMIGHYLRNLFNILRWVHFSEAIKTYDEKMDYIRIIRAQLSSHELKIIYYNCMYHEGYRMKALADTYDLFDNLKTTNLWPLNIKELYENIEQFDPNYNEKVKDLFIKKNGDSKK